MKKERLMKLVFLMFLSLTFLAAKDLGTFGETFPIAEKSLLEVIKTKLQKLQDEGRLALHQEEIKARLLKTIYRPSPVEGIKTTKEPRTYTYDPSIIIPSDLKDHEGRIIQTTGTVINPLNTVSLSKALLFIDGDDEKQVSWALAQNKSAPAPKIILISGSPFELMEKHDLRFYFDQGGAITKKFKIAQVPARVTQSGLILKIEEVFCDETF